MRILLLALICLFALGCGTTRPTAVSSVGIRQIIPRYMEAWQFKRVREYMTGAEESGDRLILRTNPDVRDGYYFILILDEQLRRLPHGTVVVGKFHTPKSPEVQEYSFNLPAKRPRGKELFLGLTGEDWPFGETRVPSAWHFTIKDANGNSLGTAKSYLWSL